MSIPIGSFLKMSSHCVCILFCSAKLLKIISLVSLASLESFTENITKVITDSFVFTSKSIYRVKCAR